MSCAPNWQNVYCTFLFSSSSSMLWFSLINSGNSSCLNGTNWFRSVLIGSVSLTGSSMAVDECNSFCSSVSSDGTWASSEHCQCRRCQITTSASPKVIKIVHFQSISPTTLVVSKLHGITSDISSVSLPSSVFGSPPRPWGRNEGGWRKGLNKALLARDEERAASSRTEEVREKERWGESVVRSLFWVLRRGEAIEEVERREDVVEERLDGWKEEQKEGPAEDFMSREAWGKVVEVWSRNLFSRFGGA